MKKLIILLLFPITLYSQSMDTIVTPVELLNFDVNCDEIAWSTASEINNNLFVIEYSDDGINWKEYLVEPGVGNSNEVFDYDISIDNKTGYYRLKQIDFDGTTEYLEIRFIDCNEDIKKPLYHKDLRGVRIDNINTYRGFYISVYDNEVIKKIK